MNTKKKILEKINKRMDMLTECVRPPVTFTESEVIAILNEIVGLDLDKMSNPPTKEDLNEIYGDKEIHTTKFNVDEAYKNALKKKGVYVDYSKVPKGAML